MDNSMEAEGTMHTQEPEVAFEWNIDDEFWSSFFSFKGVADLANQSPEPVPSPSGENSASPLFPGSRHSLNPFFHRIRISYFYYFVLVVMTILLFILRVVLMFLCVLAACLFGFIGTMGVSYEDFQKHPPSWWRRLLRYLIAKCIMRLYFFIAGFYWIRVEGKQVSSKEAPILVVAPHSSLWDTMIVCKLGAPSIVAKAEQQKAWFFGRLTNFTRPIYVDRNNPTSRRDVAREIVERATKAQSDNYWPQILIYPEATCTNRSNLISFKPGAFLPGVPVQPVLIRYPNKFDCLSWTFDGISGGLVIWLTMCQFINYVQIEFLPVYTPSKDEKGNPQLFGRNVRRLMADRLGIGTKEDAVEDGFVVDQLCFKSSIKKKLHVIRRARAALRVGENRESDFIKENKTNTNIDWKVTSHLFLYNLKFDKESREKGLNSPEIRDLFNTFNALVDTSNAVPEKIDFREYLFFAMFFQEVEIDGDKIMSLLFWMYCPNANTMSKDTFLLMMDKLFDTPKQRAEELFLSRNTAITAINLDEFKIRLSRRIEYLKLCSMEESGELGSIYPPTETRAELKDNKEHTD